MVGFFSASITSIKEVLSILKELIITNKSHAFTIIELLLTLMIFSILSMFIVPSYFGYQIRQAISLKAWEIKTALELARSIAIAEYTQIKVCPVNPTFKCVSHSGVRFIVFNDSNSNHQWDIDEYLYKDIAIDEFDTKLSASGRSFIRLKHNGESMESGNMAICDPDKTDFAKQVIIFHSGRIRISQDQDADGYDEKIGRKLICKNSSAKF
jgi:type IV fimbrial biogenesis protein FimT